MRHLFFAALLALGALMSVGCGCHRQACTSAPIEGTSLRPTVVEPPLAPPPPSQLPPTLSPDPTH